MNTRSKCLALALFAVLEFASVARGQTTQTLSALNQCTAPIDVTGFTTLGMQMTGTWSATLQPEVAIGGQPAVNSQVTPSTSTTAQSTITANGGYVAGVAGYSSFLICVSAYVSGTVTIRFQGSRNTNAALFGSGGSGSLPVGLAFTLPTLTISSATNGNGAIALSGNTSGVATCTAPAVAGTITNGVLCTNAFWGVGYRASNGGGGLSFSGSSLVVAAVGTAGTVFIQDNAGNNYFSCTSTLCSAAVALNFGFSGGKGQHFITQAANNDYGGVCTGSTTTCAVAFTTAYTSTPACVITPTTAGVTSAIITTQANTGFTVTYAPSAATTFNYMCTGNPN